MFCFDKSLIHFVIFLSTTMSGVPFTSTFSFKAPYPATPSPLKQRRVSLALPSAPRIVQPWNFRDDTGLDSHVPETEAAHQLMPEKRGKMRKIALADEEDVDPTTEKRQRKKWSAEETQMLVDGCNRVCFFLPWNFKASLTFTS